MVFEEEERIINASVQDIRSSKMRASARFQDGHGWMQRKAGGFSPASPTSFLSVYVLAVLYSLSSNSTSLWSLT